MTYFRNILARKLSSVFRRELLSFPRFEIMHISSELARRQYSPKRFLLVTQLIKISSYAGAVIADTILQAFNNMQRDSNDAIKT